MLNKTILASSIIVAFSPAAYADNTFTFDEVVVNATRSNSQITDTAASVEVITDDNIEESMVTGLDDLFKYTPGVSVETNPRQGVQSINIRGIEGNRIKVLVDGVSQGNQFESGRDFVNSSRVEVDTDMLKAVEIVKGAASSLHGSDAIGGIVAFETKDPRDFLKGRDIGGHLKFNYSSADNTFSESVALANRFGDLETLVAYTRKDGNELDNFGDLGDENHDANNLLVKLQYQLNDAHRFEFNGSHINNASSGDLDYSGYTDAVSDDRTTNYQLGVKHIWDLQSHFADTFEWQFTWLEKEENGKTHRYKPDSDNHQTKDYFYKEDGFEFSTEFEKYLNIGNVEHYIVYGISYTDKDISNTNHEHNSSSEDVNIYYIPDATEKRYGIYIQDEITFGRVIVTPGIRYDAFKTNPGDTTNNPSGNDPEDYKEFSDSAVTGRLGTVYKINEEHRLFAQVSQGFRAPDFQELYYSFGNPNHGYINKPNPNLEAEESISYEFGWRHNTNYSSSEVALFYSDYDNFIANSSSLNSDGLLEFQNINIDEAIIKGIEISNLVSWNNFIPVQGFSSRISAAYSEGKDGDGNPINEVNPWNMVVGLNYDSSNDWGTSISLNYTASKDSKDINGDDILPISSATVLDFTAYYRPIKSLTLRAGIFNITDKEYYHWSDVRGIQNEQDKDLTQASRNWAVTAKYEF